MAVFRVIPPGDLALKNGSPYLISGPAYIRQKLSARIKFFLGEWFLNQLEGVPYYRDVFVDDPNIDVVTSLLGSVIKNCPGVLSVASHKVDFDPINRTLSLAFQAIVDGGEVVVSSSDQDFIVDLNRLAA